MKKITLAFVAAATLGMGALSAPAQAQPMPHHYHRPPHVVVVPPPPPRHYVRPGYGPRYDHRWDHRHDRRDYRHGARRDSDRDGVPDRYDRRPGNPYRY